MDEAEDWLRLFRATFPELYEFVSRRVGGERALAEDVTQETWLRAVKAWRASGPPSEPLAWLKTTARNIVSNYYRDARRRPLAAVQIDLEGHPAPAAAEGSPAHDAAAIVQHGLSCLRTQDAALVEAFHLDGKSTRELAAEHGLSQRAIEGRLHRARLMLKRILQRSQS